MLTRSSRSVSEQFVRTLHTSALIGYGPDFDRHTVFQRRTLLGDFQRFIEIAQLQEKVAANGFLGLSKWAICDRPSLPRNYLTVTFERLGCFDFALHGKPFKPPIPMPHDLLDLFRGETFIPLCAPE